MFIPDEIFYSLLGNDYTPPVILPLTDDSAVDLTDDDGEILDAA